MASAATFGLSSDAPDTGFSAEVGATAGAVEFPFELVVAEDLLGSPVVAGPLYLSLRSGFRVQVHVLILSSA